MVYYQPENEFEVREINPAQAKSSTDLGELKKKKKRKPFSRLKYVFLAILFAFILGGGYFLYNTSAAFDKMTGHSDSLIKSIAKMLPFSDNFFQILPTENKGESAIDQFNSGKLDRMNILLLGYRGVDDPNGGLLTDSMMVISIKKSTGEVALISVPRDLYVTLPHSESKGKINEAYAVGTKNGGWQSALSFARYIHTGCGRGGGGGWCGSPDGRRLRCLHRRCRTGRRYQTGTRFGRRRHHRSSTVQGLLSIHGLGIIR